MPRIDACIEDAENFPDPAWQGRVKQTRRKRRSTVVLLPTGMFVLWSIGAMMTCASDRASSDMIQRPRARDLGIQIGILPTGPQNAITDVRPVRVGQRTIIAGSDVRTGVTVVIPHDGNVFQQKVPAAIAVGNGFGKLIGVTQVNELGLLETPIALTNTLSTFTVANALVRFTLQQPGNSAVRSVNPVVGECNDGALNDIRRQQVKIEHVLEALDAASDGLPLEGSVGAGTGTRCFGWKGGIGTASRVVPDSAGGYTVGALVQTNFDGILNVAGAPVGRELNQYYLRRDLDPPAESQDEGSCMIIIATDAPLDSRQLGRLARRALLGLAAVGSPMTHGSGDYVISFSSHPGVRVPYRPTGADQAPMVVRDEALSPLFQAAREATEESILNSIFKASTVQGFQGNRAVAIPIDRVLHICQKYGVINSEGGTTGEPGQPGRKP